MGDECRGMGVVKDSIVILRGGFEGSHRKRDAIKTIFKFYCAGFLDVTLYRRVVLKSKRLKSKISRFVYSLR